MIEHRVAKQTPFACALLALALAATPAFAVNKDMVQLQTQVRELQDSIARLQQSNDERMGVLRDLVQQSADSVNKMSLAVGALQQQMHNQQEGSGGKIDQVSGQVQSVNDSLDEVKARLNSLEKSVQSVQSQQQSINAALQNLGSAGSTPGSTGGIPASVPSVGNQAPMQPAPGANAGGKPSAYVPFPAHQGPPSGVPSTVADPAAQPVADLYKTALSDFMAAKYALATSEFGEVIRNYPDDPLTGNAYYYLGQIDYTDGRYPSAIKNYDHVVNQFPANPKVPVSRLHKGMALFALKDRDSGITELRALIQRFPNSPEAAQARSKLTGMGVSSASARRP
jgi:tol-pal system protein YbgF